MRLFVAIDIDDLTRAQFAGVRRAIENAVSTARQPPRITWVKDEAAHVTVRFIGEADDDTCERIQRALATVTFAPFDVTWDAVGTFGGRHRPRVIWVAAASGEKLAAVAQAVNTKLDPIVGPCDARPFRPHVTVGRIRDAGRGVNWPHALATAQWVPTVTYVDRVVLYQSRLSPKGPTYTALSSHG